MIRNTIACCNCFKTERHPEYYGWSRWGIRWVCSECLNTKAVYERYSKETGYRH